MCLDCFALVLCHLWSHLKTSVPGQSQAQYLKCPEIQQNKQQVCGGVALEQGYLFPSPCPALAEQHLDFWELPPSLEGRYQINKSCPALGWFFVRSRCMCQVTAMTGWLGVPDLAVVSLHASLVWDGIIIPCWG